MPKVSIIIPTYNRASYLKKAVESILFQNFDDYEIIIVDNASTDNTEEIIKEIGSNKIIYCKNKENIGMIGNHNRALSLIKGEYIHIFSDDDTMCQNSISKKVAILDKYINVGLVHSNINIINEEDVIISGHWGHSYYDKWKDIHSIDSLLLGIDYFKILYYHWNVISMPSVMVRSSVLEKAGAYFNAKMKFAMDLEMWMRICLFSDVYYINEILVNYRVHSSNNILIEDKVSTYEEFKRIKESLFEEFPNKILELRLEKKDIDEISMKQVEKYPLLLDYEYIKSDSYVRRVMNLIKRILVNLGR
ncbi:glycosyltransferase [Hymenobacter aerilatus]|uniref:Glycosyltransferase n=1 Tax=Hymenobacter aerilatus TaxID=2932251 RepID=A0A8T9SW26_9BACT|nr:glycosyltransferase [Hymenobacter aerilatus]UOR03949.1 glycosyltransferase [Hymenobacter aerilatus]